MFTFESINVILLVKAMELIPVIIFYTFIFLSVYAQVFFFVTFIENRKRIVIRDEEIKLGSYPTVTIVVPCWNEEKTVEKTVSSLLNLNYPKDKINIFLIDDGSTDGTLSVINRFKGYSNVRVFSKENGGKYTALNLGIKNSRADFFGCLDADSFVEKDALVRIMSYFEKDSDAMAVVPSVTVHDPKNYIQYAQKTEYSMGVYFKKMLDFLGAIHVTPGPFTIFNKKVFSDLGPYKHGHNTEDMEIAFRMQKNKYKIVHCNDAYVYTKTPVSIKKLYKQRVRWIYGFINNIIDYRNVLFRKKYGNFALFTLPVGIVSSLSVSYLFGQTAYNIIKFLYYKIVQFEVLGFNFSIKNFNFDPFFINTQTVVFLIISLYFFIIFAIFFGKKMTKENNKFSLNELFYFPVFSMIAPFWLLKGVYNTILSRRPSWR